MNIAGIYLSGTGNTRHCIEKLVKLVDAEADVVAIESSLAAETIKESDTIYIGYPVQFSNMPYMVRDYISKHSELWKGKDVFILATMSTFSGDGAGCSARLLKKYGANVLGGLHIKMPDSVSDVKLLKKSEEKNKAIIIRADEKIEKAAELIKKGKYQKNGLSFISHIAGLVGQRLWFYEKTKDYSNKLEIHENCNICGKCVRNCPMGNISIINNNIITHDRCTMCYRCISLCPKKAITLLGKEVVTQYRIESIYNEQTEQ